MSRTERIATGSGRGSGQRTLRRTTDLDPKGRGNNSLLVKQGIAEDVYAMALQRLNAMVKAELPEPQSPGVEPSHSSAPHLLPTPTGALGRVGAQGTPSPWADA